MSDAIAGVRRTVRELVDGTLRVTIDIEPMYRKAFWQLLPEVDMPVALAALHVDGETRDVQHGNAKGEWSEYARQLYTSSFFMSLSVCEAIGTDAQYLAFVRTYGCCRCGASAPSEAAHVRRVADGAGTGIKPRFSAIALCHACHAKQHQHGESAIGGRMWLDSQRDQFRHLWGWQALKDLLSFDHWYDVPPRVLREWAEENAVASLLPQPYQQEDV